MIHQAWFKTIDNEILLRYDTASGDTKKRKANFIKAAAIAEVQTGATLVLNDEGRRLVDKAKANIDEAQQSIFN